MNKSLVRNLFSVFFPFCLLSPSQLQAARLFKSIFTPWTHNCITIQNISPIVQTVEVTFSSTGGNISAGSAIACGNSVTCSSNTTCKTNSSYKTLQPGKSICQCVYDTIDLSESYPLDAALNIEIHTEEDRGAITAQAVKQFTQPGRHYYLPIDINGGRPF